MYALPIHPALYLGGISLDLPAMSWNDFQGKKPPSFGHAMLEYFAFDPGYTNLNHGSYGSLPRPVSAYCDSLNAEAESNPDKWIRQTYLPLLTDVRTRLATLLGAKPEECVMVPNASHGMSTVLRNLLWKAGDILVTYSTTYGSVLSTAQYISDTLPHPTLSQIKITFPTTRSVVLKQFRAHLAAIQRQPRQQVVAVIDGMVSVPGLWLPWKEMVAIAKEFNVLSLVDAAHLVGQETGLNLNEVDPDFWVSNCHKWLYAKRSAAVLYVPLRNQHYIKSTFPTSAAYLSPSARPQHEGHKNFVQQFDWTATIDFVPFLSVSAALDFRAWLGGENKINAYCRDLAKRGGIRLAEMLSTTGQLIADDGMALNMVNVRLPLPQTPALDRAPIQRKIAQRLLSPESGVFTIVWYIEDHETHSGWWTRCCAQVWSEIADFEKLGRVLLDVCAELKSSGAVDNVVHGKL
ncbi:PLP-dependent transferase [Mycena indigotica]|uniref:PLP-dependent transferase n=1 Tax=Mycena indigotica TaxID=2126181 RepID=A0A8H6W7A1_9AGAR|nr:PLP-dependent transferase [Mycena indigotica]KAF7307472.1 PLP-dependent transferase [Mycena indigotica]